MAFVPSPRSAEAEAGTPRAAGPVRRERPPAAPGAAGGREGDSSKPGSGVIRVRAVALEGVARAARTRAPGLRGSHVWAALCAVSLRRTGGGAGPDSSLAWVEALGVQVPATCLSPRAWPPCLFSAGAGAAGGRRPVALRGRAGAGGGGSGLRAGACVRAAAALPPHGPGRAWGPGCAGPDSACCSQTGVRC